MSILQYPDAMNAPELQVWNNAAFDNDESEGRWSSCLEPDPVFVNRSTDSVRSDFSSKENMSPLGFAKTPVAVSAKPLGANTAILNSQSKPPKLVFKEEEKVRDEKRIDSEIEEIEREISRLSTRLEALRIEKAEQNAARTVEKRGRIVPAKFLEPPARQSFKNSSEESFLPPSCGAKSKGLNRRGMSLGPSEIVAGAGLRRLSKLEITPVQSAQNRRKSCYWKLQEIDELRATKEKGKSMSVSPKSRRAASKTQQPKQPATTACSSGRVAKKEEAILAAIQPKKLFRDGEKSAAATTGKKPARPGRVVASRYNSAASNDGRKRSLPDEEKEDEAKRCERKRMSLAGKPSRGKKKWEIPSEVVVFRGSAEEEEEKSPSLALPVAAEEEKRGEVLPRIRTFRWAEKSPRDSGPAKRVAELVGRRSVFSSDEEVIGELSVCQALSFGEEEEVEK